jgi:cytochrome c-type biogenesis protein CcmF
MGADIGTPSVRTGWNEDIYLTLGQGVAPGDTEATIRVFIKPMILWLWIGGAVMALGTLLAAFPGSRRRNAIDPVSAPIGLEGSDPDDAAGNGGSVSRPPVDVTESEDRPTEVPV